jgi:hypothetical protein
MKRLLIIAFSGRAFALAPTMSASAMPAATPYMEGVMMRQSFRSKAATAVDTDMVGPSWRSHYYCWLPRPTPRLAASLVVTFIFSQTERGCINWPPGRG